ncbi:ABC transporter permease [Conexibacter stalactiti]|uniref:ABC transporter permease n=1 Tax=Conexibacter stalactiti TaxID=1940611 RepID=A0ABU4HSE1_9ACTN|nr:ABC transporter permease [Conexibacter stalactiti]MDW5596237.1 ABC transporter permease [Conexibacter stalactiti]MEC5036879.1 ABC transporter permease [Conexibacter stalactiti]
MQRDKQRRGVLDLLRVRDLGIVYALILLVVVLTIVSAATGRPNYLGGDNVANILDQASLVGILAVFMTVVLVSGNFDLSVGSIGALAAAISLSVIDERGVVVAVLLAIGAAAAAGLVNGLIVQVLGINAFIVTLGTMTALRGVVLILTDGRTITAESSDARTALQSIESGFWTVNVPVILGVLALLAAGAAFAAGHRGRRLAVLGGGGAILAIAGFAGDMGFRYAKPVWYMAAITLMTWAVLRFTVVGRRLYATGANMEAARLSGINVARYKVVPFVLTGAAAGVVGVLYGAKLGATNPTALNGLELTVIAAAILGGTSLFGGSGSVITSVVGALFLFTIANGFNVLNLGANYQDLIEGVVLIVAAGVYTVASRRKARAGSAPEPPEDGASTPAGPAATSTATPPARAEALHG